MPERKALQDFYSGIRCLHTGIGIFLRTPALWKYALIPMGIILVLYGLLLFVLIAWVIPPLVGLLPDPAGWSVWLRWLIYAARVVIGITAVAAALMTGALLRTTLYEAFGAPFFDALVMRFERMRYGVEHAPLPWRKNLEFMLQSFCYSMVTTGWSLLLFLPAMFIPLVGWIPPVLIVGYRYGLTYTFSSAFADGLGIAPLREAASRRRMVMLGFGCAGYLWLLIPFSAILLLPGFAVGGAMLYREQLRPAIGLGREDFS